MISRLWGSALTANRFTRNRADGETKSLLTPAEQDPAGRDEDSGHPRGPAPAGGRAPEASGGRGSSRSSPRPPAASGVRPLDVPGDAVGYRPAAICTAHPRRRAAVRSDGSCARTGCTTRSPGPGRSDPGPGDPVVRGSPLTVATRRGRPRGGDTVGAAPGAAGPKAVGRTPAAALRSVAGTVRPGAARIGTAHRRRAVPMPRRAPAEPGNARVRPAHRLRLLRPSTGAPLGFNGAVPPTGRRGSARRSWCASCGRGSGRGRAPGQCGAGVRGDSRCVGVGGGRRTAVVVRLVEVRPVGLAHPQLDVTGVLARGQ
ncbi:hypothetical protein SUDANB176_07245 [Streptomyces sp. enrichment culture]